MKAWTLIGFYLLKDIWRRWFETPGGVLSRLLVAFILGLLLLVIDSAFTLSAASIQRKISQMGVRTIVVTRAVGGMDAVREADRLANLLAPLRAEGELLRLRQAGDTAVDEFGGKRTLRIYGRDLMEALSRILPSAPASDVFVVTDKMPAGMKTTVRMADMPAVEAIAVPPPSWLGKFGGEGLSMLAPAEAYPELLEKGFFEIIVFLGNDGADLEMIERRMGTLLQLEDLGNVQISSPRDLLAQLDKLEDTQRRWQGGFGIFGGVAIALVFGSIAVLEYRQNRYIVALLKSFGAPSALLGGRYFVEAALLVAAAGFLAHLASIQLHTPLFRSIGIEPGLLDRGVIDPYSPARAWSQLRWLGFGAVLSVIPIAFAIRSPVGRTLS